MMVEEYLLTRHQLNILQIERGGCRYHNLIDYVHLDKLLCMDFFIIKEPEFKL